MPGTKQAVAVNADGWTNLTTAFEMQAGNTYYLQNIGLAPVKLVYRADADSEPAAAQEGVVLPPYNWPGAELTQDDGFTMWGRVQGDYPADSLIIAEAGQ